MVNRRPSGKKVARGGRVAQGGGAMIAKGPTLENRPYCPPPSPLKVEKGGGGLEWDLDCRSGCDSPDPPDLCTRKLSYRTPRPPIKGRTTGARGGFEIESRLKI
jgi:hypothetical protein